MAPPAPSPGPIYCFLPVAGDPRVAEMTRRLVSSLQAFLDTEPEGRTAILADFASGAFAGNAGAQVPARTATITCMDLSNADPAQLWRAVKQCEAVFVVSSTDLVSMHAAREKAQWLRAMKTEEAYGLVLLPSVTGLTGRQAEEVTGLPVCAVLEGEKDLLQLARWIALE